MILIAGGEGKGADFSPLAPAIKQHVKHVITLGKDGDEIGKLAQYHTKVTSLNEAVMKAEEQRMMQKMKEEEARMFEDMRKLAQTD